VILPALSGLRTMLQFLRDLFQPNKGQSAIPLSRVTQQRVTYDSESHSLGNTPCPGESSSMLSETHGTFPRTDAHSSRIRRDSR
jgi:hypothetical protein